MSATFEGKPWTASFTLAQTMQMGGKPMLNLSGTEQGSPTMTFNSMLELKDPNDLAGGYPLKTGSPANGQARRGHRRQIFGHSGHRPVAISADRHPFSFTNPCFLLP
ncbi:MAG: hypothetical protein E5W15_14050 [Mesorhizobium sp.]|nr:MAG: hypothetical protein E5W15_14050 [Mesorhizobium sp.]